MFLFEFAQKKGDRIQTPQQVLGAFSSYIDNGQKKGLFDQKKADELKNEFKKDPTLENAKKLLQPYGLYDDFVKYLRARSGQDMNQDKGIGAAVLATAQKEQLGFYIRRKQEDETNRQKEKFS